MNQVGLKEGANKRHNALAVCQAETLADGIPTPLAGYFESLSAWLAAHPGQAGFFARVKNDAGLEWLEPKIAGWRLAAEPLASVVIALGCALIICVFVMCGCVRLLALNRLYPLRRNTPTFRTEANNTVVCLHRATGRLFATGHDFTLRQKRYRAARLRALLLMTMPS